MPNGYDVQPVIDTLKHLGFDFAESPDLRQEKIGTAIQSHLDVRPYLSSLGLQAALRSFPRGAGRPSANMIHSAARPGPNGPLQDAGILYLPLGGLQRALNERRHTYFDAPAPRVRFNRVGKGTDFPIPLMIRNESVAAHALLEDAVRKARRGIVINRETFRH